MLKILPLSFLLAFSAHTLIAQTSSDYAVQLEAKVQQSPARITLTWKPLANTLSYKIYRKAKGAASWGTELVSLTTADTSWTDNNVAVDSVYEYQVVKQGTPITATGYICAGIKAPAIHNRGAILVIVDDLFNVPCEEELARLMRDLRGDGWEVLRVSFPRTASPHADIKPYIQNTYTANPNLKAVLLVGHIPVPYSGDIYPDGHTNHKGAWPSDTYYADVNGTWNDANVNITSAPRVENDNVPGDGKWDESFIPSDLDLQVGRIDFADMPIFSKTEVQMMKDYLNKDHVYKMDSLGMIKRALIDDNFPATTYPEAFAANGWRNFNPIVGRDSIRSLDFISTLNSAPYQWAYGCGAGSYTSASGIGSTSSFTTNDVNTVFTFLFGSYFGDFDATNNFLRAPLCSDNPALTSSWAGRPNQYLHHMALGEHIGYSTLISQNNDGFLYGPGGFANRMVHQALMGDLSLRTDYIKPAGKPTVTSSATTGTTITWAASPDPDVTGYYVYRSNSEFGQYTRRSGLVTGTSFLDSFGSEGMKHYMVRPAKWQQTPSGVYENLGIGMADSGYSYYFGFDVSVPVLAENTVVTVFPNPSPGMLHIGISNNTEQKMEITVTDMTGRKLHSETRSLTTGNSIIAIDMDRLPAGVYLVTVATGQQRFATRWMKK